MIPAMKTALREAGQEQGQPEPVHKRACCSGAENCLRWWRDERARGQHSLIPGRSREKRSASISGLRATDQSRSDGKPRELPDWSQPVFGNSVPRVAYGWHMANVRRI